MDGDTPGVKGAFGKNLVLVKGWDYGPLDYKLAWEEGRLLTGQIETSNICNLMCEYCFREELGADEKRMLSGEISLEQTLCIVDTMAGLGARTINIVGAGEPTIDGKLPRIIRHIASNGITPVIFTHGANLTDELVGLLNETEASVIIKINSFDQKIQNRMVQRNWYSKRRDEGLRKLIRAGFNSPSPDGEYRTRLGVDSVICEDNKNCIVEIFRWCRENNAMPLIKTFIPAGRTKNRMDSEISKKEFLTLSQNARKIDRQEYGITYDSLLPYLGGVPCTQNGKASMYVTILGDVYECPGQKYKYGNIAKYSGSALKRNLRQAFAKIRTEQSNYCFGCPPRMHYWRKD